MEKFKLLFPDVVKYIGVKQIGDGRHGPIMLVRDIINGSLYVVKVLSLEKPNDEISILEEATCRYIPKLHGTIKSKYCIGVVMDYGDKGDLLEKVLNEGLLSEDKFRPIFIKLCSCLLYSHQECIIHRDIKLENIFLKSDGGVFLGDWDLASCGDLEVKGRYGTLYYSSPEAITHAKIGYDGMAADVWALGVVLFSATIGTFPFFGKNKKMISRILQGLDSRKISPRLSKELRHLIMAMLEYDPTKRIKLSQILRHPWITGISMSPRASFLSLPFNIFRKMTIEEYSKKYDLKVTTSDNAYYVSHNCFLANTKPKHKPPRSISAVCF